MTKEECVKALSALYFSDGTDGRDDECYNVLMELINEHFDNPPLKFEELEVGLKRKVLYGNYDEVEE